MDNEAYKCWVKIESLINQIVESQQKEVLKLASRIVPHITSEDVLQPNDFIELENHPHFRFEEGVLSGIQTTQMALLALKKESGFLEMVDHSM